MNLGLCIANLLRQYPAVEVPGIGVFKIKRESAAYDKTTHAFQPPVQFVELTKKSSDSFPITKYLQVQRRIDESTAIDMLEKAVADLMDSISRNGQALLDGLGYLFADGTSFAFKPFETGNLRWKPVDESVVPVPEAELVVISKPDVADAEIIEEETVDEGVPVSGMHESKEEADKVSDSKEYGQSTGHSKRGWIVAAVSAAVLLAAGVFWYYNYTSSGQRRGVATQPPEQQEVKPVEANVPVTLDRTGDTPVLAADSVGAAGQTAAEHVNTDTVAVVKPAKPAISYEIIVGSFATMAQAKKYLTEMKAKGYDLTLVDNKMPGNRKKISWGSFATEEEAYRELSRVQKNFEPGAWIAKIVNE